ncbi:Uncharacterized protein LI90_3031 [Carbonactinospora thermoautotrophica]|uniref:DUF2637 domain-containing protein n=1 Tax=Carbonactinospora thermoautotrophica TaxID=1469144 RepID=A0A132MW82_9ACTN|nr:DUF2637 domain-containing protein [Carbonactinospora thermoautotrophica]KWX01996.1 Uncharacterized protein LI90_3031 [Carbonactinospora thermoautotrophica]
MSRVRRLVAAVVDVGPLVALAGIAGAGSFTHIKTTAAEHGQSGWMAWAVAVCIDLMAVMAGREIRRDRKLGCKPRNRLGVSWPLVVLVASIGLSLAANLEQAGPGPWGKVVAAVPAGAFLIAVSLIERRGTHTPANPVPEPAPEPEREPGRVVVERAPAEREVPPAETPVIEPVPAPANPEPTPTPAPAAQPAAASAAPAEGPAAHPLLAFARRVAEEHRARHGTDITPAALGVRLRVSSTVAADLLRQLGTPAPQTA